MLNVFLGFIYSTFESLVNHRTFICLLPVSPLAYSSHEPPPHDQHPHQRLSEGPTVNAESMDFTPSKDTPFRELKGTRIQMMIARILHEFTLIKNPDPGKHNWCRLEMSEIFPSRLCKKNNVFPQMVTDGTTTNGPSRPLSKEPSPTPAAAHVPGQRWAAHPSSPGRRLRPRPCCTLPSSPRSRSG